MSTPTPSANRPQVFSYCWSALNVHHTIAYHLPASLSQDSSCSDPSQKYIPSSGSCSTGTIPHSKTPAFTHSFVMQQFCSVTLLCRGVLSAKSRCAAHFQPLLFLPCGEDRLTRQGYEL